MLVQGHDKRREVPRRCAWCLRFCVRGRWRTGRRSTDAIAPGGGTHTICDECVERLQRHGMSV